MSDRTSNGRSNQASDMVVPVWKQDKNIHGKSGRKKNGEILDEGG